ncbi:MAG: rRNA maturation RNase YbeY [Chloroflexi bacterium]|nr:MAG: rRNA maturation RNase YbeY [Chloroflexota bacterium]
MRAHLARRAADQGRVLRAPPRCVPRAHPVPRGPHHPHPPGCVLRVTVDGRAPCALPPLRAAIRAALRPIGLPRETEVSLAFVDDATQRGLNRRHRRIDRTTDVLSFGQRLPRRARGPGAARHLVADPDGVLRLGDIVVSSAQAARQARRGGRRLADEVALLVAHGALHLVGYEDETAGGYREMVRLGKLAVRQKMVKR